MPRDERTFITVHDGMPEHPKVEGLSDAAFRALFRAAVRDINSVPAGFSEFFRGPFRGGRRRARIPDEFRRSVYERDGYACVECGAVARLTLDHIHPWSRGGEDTYDNLRTLCVSCNCRKGARV